VPAGQLPNPASRNPLGPAPAKDLTLTGIYNVLQALREGRPLTAKEKHIHSAALVGVLKTLHDELDAAVLGAYGWADLQAALAANPASAECATAQGELLARLVALNARRAAQEAAGHVRWLRPAFQNPQSKQELPAQVQQGLEVDFAYKTASTPVAARPWPASLPAQVKAVVQVLASSPTPLSLAQLQSAFTGRGQWHKSLPTLLQTLEAPGRAQRLELASSVAWHG
jgi:hypothetical protein